VRAPSHHCRTVGDYWGALWAGPATARELAASLGVPAYYAEDDLRMMAELGALEDLGDGRYARRGWRKT